MPPGFALRITIYAPYDVTYVFDERILELSMGTQTQVISADGAYEEAYIGEFLERNSLSEAGVSYTTVAIMGPQSSGKSTLLNAVVRSSGHREITVVKVHHFLMRIAMFRDRSTSISWFLATR